MSEADMAYVNACLNDKQFQYDYPAICNHIDQLTAENAELKERVGVLELNLRTAGRSVEATLGEIDAINQQLATAEADREWSRAENQLRLDWMLTVTAAVQEATSELNKKLYRLNDDTPAPAEATEAGQQGLAEKREQVFGEEIAKRLNRGPNREADQ